eukprot:6206948-Pleurochrysis_carterae.AAC.1
MEQTSKQGSGLVDNITMKQAVRWGNRGVRADSTVRLLTRCCKRHAKAADTLREPTRRIRWHARSSSVPDSRLMHGGDGVSGETTHWGSRPVASDVSFRQPARWGRQHVKGDSLICRIYVLP